MSAEFKDFVGKACKGRTAFEFLPKSSKNLDLERIRKKLAGKGISIEASTPLVLIFNFDNSTISLFKSGKVLIKEKNEQKAKRLVRKLLEFL